MIGSALDRFTWRAFSLSLLNCSLHSSRKFYSCDFLSILICMGWRRCLTHCATNRKETGSIPGNVIGIFHWHNRSGRTMPQSLTAVSTRNISWGGKGGQCVGLTNLSPSRARCFERDCKLRWGCPGLYGDCFTFTFTERNATNSGLFQDYGVRYT